jgi:hypothetical protein
MITATVEVVRTSEAQIILRLGKIPQQAQAGFRRGAMAAAIALANHIKEQKLSGQSLKTRTGTGRRSVRARQLGDGAAVTVDNVAWYLKLHEFGVPHPWTIEPKNAKALAFKIDGVMVFAKKVTHPGLKEKAFMRDSLREMKPELLQIINRHITAELRK